MGCGVEKQGGRGIFQALGFGGKEFHSANSVVTVLCRASSFWDRHEMVLVKPPPHPPPPPGLAPQWEKDGQEVGEEVCKEKAWMGGGSKRT